METFFGIPIVQRKTRPVDAYDSVANFENNCELREQKIGRQHLTTSQLTSSTSVFIPFKPSDLILPISSFPAWTNIMGLFRAIFNPLPRPEKQDQAKARSRKETGLDLDERRMHLPSKTLHEKIDRALSKASNHAGAEWGSVAKALPPTVSVVSHANFGVHDAVSSTRATLMLSIPCARRLDRHQDLLYSSMKRTLVVSQWFESTKTVQGLQARVYGRAVEARCPNG